MAALQPAGVRAVAEGVDKYVGDMRRMGTSTASMGSSLSRMAEIAGGIIASQVFTRIADAFMSVARGAAEFGRESILTAARVQELDVILGVIGKTAGIPKEKLDGMVESIKDLGITTTVAQGLLIDFARYQLDMADATKLARLAQDAAGISMQDSSEALDGLMHGIITMNTRVLRTYGITLASVSNAQAKYAEEIGKTADELDETERIQAVLNAVLIQGEQIVGTYEAIMETAGKQMRSMKRHVHELMISIGKPFLGAFAAVIEEATNWLKYFREITEEGTVLNRMLKAVASVIGKVFVRAFNRMTLVFEFVMKHVSNLWEAIEAGRGIWGQLGHVVQLFMNRIKPLHGEFLPRLVELFQRYLLPVIEKVMKAFVFFAQAIALGQGPVHAMIEALSVLVPRELVPSILKLHEKWDGFVSSIREFLDKHKDKIVAGFKAIGLAIAVYIVSKKVLGMIKAFGILLGALTSPIGLLLTAIGILGIAWEKNFGGIRDVVKNVWENTLKPIVENVVKWFKEKVPEAIQTVVDYIESFIRAIQSGQSPLQAFLMQLEGFIPIQIVERIGGFIELVKDIVRKAFVFVVDHQDEIIGAIKAIGIAISVYLVTKKILGMITGLGKVIGLLTNPIGLLLAAIGLFGAAWAGNWGGIRDKLTEFWEKTGRPIFESIKEWLSEAIPQAIEIARTFWEETLQPALERVWLWVKENVFPIIEDLVAWLQESIPQAIEIAKTFWEETLRPAIEDVWNWVKENVFPIIEDLIVWLEENIPIAIQALSDFWTDTLWPAMQDVWTWMQVHLFPFIEALVELIGTTLGVALEAAAGFWDKVLQPALQDLWEWVKDKIIPKLTDLWEWFKDKVGPAIEGVGVIIDTVTQFFRDLTTAIGNIQLPDWLTPESITPFEKGLRGISDAISELVKTDIPKFGKEIANLPEWGGLQADLAPSLALSQQVMPAGGQTVNNTFTLGGITTNAPREPIIADFQMLALLAEKA